MRVLTYAYAYAYEASTPQIRRAYSGQYAVSFSAQWDASRILRALIVELIAGRGWFENLSPVSGM